MWDFRDHHTIIMDLLSSITDLIGKKCHSLDPWKFSQSPKPSESSDSLDENESSVYVISQIHLRTVTLLVQRRWSVITRDDADSIVLCAIHAPLSSAHSQCGLELRQIPVTLLEMIRKGPR
jgi:hypothetical protein